MAETFNIHDAKTHFSRLVERVERGERITIARAGRPVAMLVAIEPETRPKRPIGMDKGLVFIGDDFDDPVEEWDPDYRNPDDPLNDPAG